MLDLFGILFSSVMMLMVIVRAVRLDRILPWFEAVKHKEEFAEAPVPAWRRGR